MKIRERLSRLNHAQHSRLFKIIASCIVVVAAIAGAASYAVIVTAPGEPGSAQVQTPPTPGMDQQTRSALDASARVVENILAARQDPTSMAVGIGIVAAVALIVIWLGLGLTYLVLLGLAAGVAWPLSLVPGTKGVALLLAGIVALTASFAALVQVLRVVLAGPGVVLAIARNTLTEAIRLKISLVFIVLLILALASLPGLLDAEVPLRYRVQTFLQYGTGGSFWIIALLTLFFSTATISFEQRDRVIWQTMTKPVASWQYLLGKWMGVLALNAALLAVCASGVFLFTEYLRSQPAIGERQAYEAVSGGLTKDRRILETGVLAARKSVGAEPPEIDEVVFQRNVESKLKDLAKSNDLFRTANEDLRRKVESDLRKGINQQYRSIEPATSEVYVFTGLKRAKERNELVTLRYKIDAGSNRPDALYKLMFIVNGQIIPQWQEVLLGHMHTLDLSPLAIDDNGMIQLEIINGALVGDRVQPNPLTITFPPGGLEIMYQAGSYRANFLRVVMVLWVKLAFLSMVSMVAATFLSFPVACLVAFGVFFAAEGAVFLSESLKYYEAIDHEGNIVYWQIPIRAISLSVAWMFETYAQLKPTTKLVDGKLLTVLSVAKGTVVLATWSAVLYFAGTIIFRNRELATYSGH